MDIRFIVVQKKKGNGSGKTDISALVSCTGCVFVCMTRLHEITTTQSCLQTQKKYTRTLTHTA